MSTTLQHPASLSAAWSAHATITSGTDFRNPVVTTMPSGAISVVWQAENAIMHSRYTGANWQPPARVSGGIQHSAACDDAGNLHLAFSNNYSGRFEIYHCIWNGQYWSLPLNISLTPGPSYNARILLAPDGSRHAVWEDHSPGYAAVYYARHRSGWHWEAGAVPNAVGCRPAALFDEHGRLHMAFQIEGGTNQKGGIYYTNLEKGVWLSPQRISGEHFASDVALAIDGGGRLHAAWREQLADAHVILYASGDAHGWATPSAISPVLDSGDSPALTIAKGRFLHSMWAYTEIVEQAQCDLQGQAEWTPVELAAAENYRVSDPALSADDSGRVHAVWLSQKPKGQSDLRYSMREAALPFNTFLPRIQ